MKYDVEYNSYKFSSKEIGLIVHSLISYSNDPFLDKVTQKNVIVLLGGINRPIQTSVAQ